MSKHNSGMARGAPRKSSLRTLILSAMSMNQSVLSYQPSGRNLRMTSGIFFSLSSLIAICSGSVSPSTSTRTGAFILRQSACARASTPLLLPDLQCSCAKNASSLVFGHVWCTRALVIRYSLLFQSLDGVESFHSSGGGHGVACYNHIVCLLRP